MTIAAQFPGDITVQGSIIYTGSLQPGVARSSLVQEGLVAYPIPLVHFRVWDAVQTNLPGTPAADDLGLVGGTWATAVPSLQTGDLKNVPGPTTRYARVQFQLPPEYVTGQAVSIRLYAGMKTTVASTTATVDVEAYKSNKDGTVSGADLYTGAAVTINSTTFGNKDFSLTATALAPGDWIDIRVAVAISDTGTLTEVNGYIGSPEMLLTIKG
jgi:hypothetical protein